MGVLTRHWGWVVTVTSFCIFLPMFGILFTYGQLYVEFQEEFNSSNTETGWVGSVSCSLFAIATFLTNRLLQRFSNRSIATFGVVLVAVGCFSTSLMPTFNPIFFTYGILVGCGVSFVILSALNLITKYFPGTSAHRPTAFAMTGTNSGMLAMNPVVNLMISHWGWRNMLRVMGSSILVVGLPCISTFIQPTVVGDSVETVVSNSNGGNHNTKASNSNEGNHKRLVEDEESCTINQQERSSENESKRDQHSGNHHHSAIRHQRTLKQQLQVLLFPELWFFAVATIITSAGQSFFYISYVSFLTTNGFEKSDASFVMTTIAVAEIGGKLLLFALGDNCPFPRIHLFNIASVVGACVMCALFVANQLWHLYCLAIVTGLYMSIFDAVIFSISIDVFGIERNDEATAVLLVSNGLGFLGGSLFGMSVDYFGTYDAALYSCIVTYGVAMLLYTAVPLYQRIFAKERYIMGAIKRKRKNNQKAQHSKASYKPVSSVQV